MIDIIRVFVTVFFTVMWIFLIIINISKIKFSIINFLSEISVTTVSVSLLYILLKIEILSSVFMLLSAIVSTNRKIKNVFLSLIYPIFSLLLIMTIDNCVSALVEIISRNNGDIIRQITSLYWTISTVSMLISFFLSRYLGNLLKGLLDSIPMEYKNKLYLFILFFLLFSLSIFYFNAYRANIKADPNLLLLINAMLLILDFIFIALTLFYFFTGAKKSLEIKYKQDSLMNMQLYVSGIENMYSDVCSLRHDMRNIIFSMQGYIANKDIDGLNTFFEENIAPINNKLSAQNSISNQLKNIKIPELKSLVAIKLLNAVETGIKVHVEVYEPVDHLDIDIVDMVRITGILLDNAMEECQKEQNMQLQFAIVKLKACVKLFVINQVVEPVPISRIFQENYSTKGEGRGIGLHGLRKIISKYDRITINSYEKESQFTQEINFYAEM